MSNPFALLRSHENKARMILWLLILPMILLPIPAEAVSLPELESRAYCPLGPGNSRPLHRTAVSSHLHHGDVRP